MIATDDTMVKLILPDYIPPPKPGDKWSKRVHEVLSEAFDTIDYNEGEQLMKHTATGRKNWLFLGSIEAGYRAAILTTICSTAHRHHLDVYSYVKEVADQLLAGNLDYESMQAENWAQTHPEQVRTYRAEESRYAADRKITRRAERRRAELTRAASKGDK